MRRTVSRQRRAKRFAHQHGLTLIELAIAITVIGIAMAGALTLYERGEDQRRVLLTYQHMDQITQALSIFAESSGRVPCPGDPSLTDQRFGWERGVALADLQVVPQYSRFPTGSCPTVATDVGIVPFQTLDLTDAIARDGWGRYFTYGVSAQFTRSNDQSHSATLPSTLNTQVDLGDIHGRCRSEGWAALYDAHNISAIKARFCCADQGITGNVIANELWNTVAYNNTSDIVIKHTSGAVISPLRDPTSYTTGTEGAAYNNLTSTVTATVGAKTLPAPMTSAVSKILAPAFALISYGPDGAGAYLGNGTSNLYNAPAQATLPLEWQNANPVGATNLTFYDGPTNRASGTTYYNDIMRWMTQDGLMAAHGALSCQYP
jgi:prepilin-type N-terminal cleavage/methylation domain-containing protein